MSQEQAGQPVFCPRHQVMKDPDTHLACPYCFGRVAEAIQPDAHPHFCDFDPEHDPVVFGFPTDTSRNLG